MAKKKKSFPTLKIFLSAVLVVLAPLIFLTATFFIAPNKYAQWFLGQPLLMTTYNDPQNSYTLEYPRTWTRGVGKDNNTLYISPNSFTYEELQHQKFPGGFIAISTMNLNDWFSIQKYADMDYADIKSFLKATANDEWESGSPLHLPVIPGVSQFEVVGKPQISLPPGFEEVTSLNTIAQAGDSKADVHMYWLIKNKKKYEIFIQYPVAISGKEQFDVALGLIAKSLVTK